MCDREECVTERRQEEGKKIVYMPERNSRVELGSKEDWMMDLRMYIDI